MVREGYALNSTFELLALVTASCILLSCGRSGNSDDNEPESGPTGIASRTVGSNSRIIPTSNPTIVEANTSSNEDTNNTNTDNESNNNDDSVANDNTDNTDPTPPTISELTLANPGPTNNNLAELSGKSSPLSNIELYTDITCSTLANTTAADANGSFTIASAVADDSVTTFYARATAGSLESECYDLSVTYTEDSTPPSTPNLTSSTPSSPSSIKTPTIIGSAEPDSKVEIYSEASCTNTLGSTTTASNGTFSIISSSLAEGTTNIYANATDSSGNKSDCKDLSLAYECYSIAAGTAYLTATETTDSSSPTNMNPSTATNLSWSDQKIDANYYSYSNTNPDRINIEQSGDYFIAITLPLQSSVTRANVMLTVAVNGTVIDSGYSSSSYMRQSNSHNESSDHIAILLTDLTSGDYITAAVTAESTVGSVTTERATMHVEYITPNRKVFSASATELLGGPTVNPTTADALSWSARRHDTGFSHDSSDPGSINLVNGGNYLVFINVPVTSSTTRAAPQLVVKVDGTMVPGGIASQGYIRSDSLHNQSSLHWSGMLSNILPGQTLSVTMEAEANSGAATVVPGFSASIMVESLSSDSGIYASRSENLSSGTNWSTASATDILWENDDIIDTNTYSHDTATNSQEVELMQKGDYLLIYNDVLTSSTARVNATVDINIDGIKLPGGSTSTHYVRISNGHTQSSGSIVLPLRSMAAGSVVSITTIQEASGTLTTFADAHFILVYKGP